jgi:hypothetical protein
MADHFKEADDAKKEIIRQKAYRSAEKSVENELAKTAQNNIDIGRLENLIVRFGVSAAQTTLIEESNKKESHV